MQSAASGKANAMKRTLKRIGIILLSILLTLLLIIGGFVIYLTAAEFKPEPVETLEIGGQAKKTLQAGDSLPVLSYNIGYGSLDQTQDFFMDGGKNVRPASDENVRDNIAGIGRIIQEANCDVQFLQEVDKSSKRSYFVDQTASLSSLIGGTNAFAVNYSSQYVPFPLPTIGKVQSGLLTLSSFGALKAERIALTGTYTWPVRVAQLKRCLLVERVPLEGSDKELVLINLHLEAYDDGDAKQIQTEELLKLLTTEYEKGNYCIAGGDFNQTFSEVDATKYPLIDSSYWQAGTLSSDILPEGWRFAVDDSAPTCRLLNQPYSGDRAKTQFYVIDGFIVSPNVEVEAVHVIETDFQYTDHNPVKLEAVLKK